MKRIFCTSIDVAAAITNSIPASAAKAGSIKQEQKVITVKKAELSEYSVSSLHLTRNAEKDRAYKITCMPVDGESNSYIENITFKKNEDKRGDYYITGLRENTLYEVTITPKLTAKERKSNKNIKDKSKHIIAEPFTLIEKTESVKVICDFPHEDGWTNCLILTSISSSPLDSCRNQIYQGERTQEYCRISSAFNAEKFDLCAKIKGRLK